MSAPSSAVAFGAFLVGLSARVVAVSASVLPSGSGLVLDAFPAPKRGANNPRESWARELRTRVSSALRSLGVEPDFSIRFDVLPPRSACLDLAVLVACLGVLGKVGADALGSTLFLGELALDGSVRPIRGVLPMLRTAIESRTPSRPFIAEDDGWRFVVPKANAEEARRAGANYVFAVESARDIANDTGFPFGMQAMLPPRPWTPAPPPADAPTMAAMLGPRVLRQLEIAAAGPHGVLLVGPERARMLAAKVLHALLPQMIESEAVETTEIHSAAAMLDHRTMHNGLVAGRPFRTPHRTCTPEGLVGGGEPMRPGEASLAHNGGLFIDEAAEFKPGALEALARALREGEVSIVRGNERATYSARPEVLVLGLAPCLCEPNAKYGRLKDDHHERVCTPDRIDRDRERVLRYLCQEIEMKIVLEEPDSEALAVDSDFASMFEETRARVIATDALAWKRSVGHVVGLTRQERIARTIADLDEREHVIFRDREEAAKLSLDAGP